MIEEMLKSILKGNFYRRGLTYATMRLNRVEVKAMIDTGATENLMKESLVPHFRLQVPSKNIFVSLTSNQRVILASIMVANLSVGTWVFFVMAMARFDAILRMEFLYNA